MGFLRFSLVNEHNTQPAYFDAFEIVHKLNEQKLTVTSWTDYYPFGKVAKTACSGAGAYRYGYQGEFAEKDNETEWNSFELRQYDSEIGRFTTTDPMGEFWSSYVGMGNDPVNLTDPTGGETMDDIYINSKTGETNTIATDSKFDNFFIDNKYVGSVRHGDLSGFIFSREGLSVFTCSGEAMFNLGNSNSWLYNKYVATGVYGKANVPEGEVPVTWDLFVQSNQQANNNFPEALYNQRTNRSQFSLSSQSGGPTMRYVYDPLDSNHILDMRHVLLMGRVPLFMSSTLEDLQFFVDKKSYNNPMDYYSNMAGYRFYNSLGKKYSNTPFPHPNSRKFLSSLDSFMRNPRLRGMITPQNPTVR